VEVGGSVESWLMCVCVGARGGRDEGRGSAGVKSV
jgi:hypothetical protein